MRFAKKQLNNNLVENILILVLSCNVYEIFMLRKNKHIKLLWIRILKTTDAPLQNDFIPACRSAKDFIIHYTDFLELSVRKS